MRKERVKLNVLAKDALRDVLAVSFCSWGHNSVIVAWALALHFPDKLHLERNTFCRPNWGELNLLYYELVDWSPNYIVHLYSR